MLKKRQTTIWYLLLANARLGDVGEDRQVKGEYMGCNYLPVESFFFPNPSLWNLWNNTEIAPMVISLVTLSQSGVICIRSSRWFLPDLSSVTFSTGEKAHKSSLCVYTPVWDWSTVQVQSEGGLPTSCVHFRQGSGCPESETFSSCMSLRYAALHQLAYAHSYTAFRRI